MNTRAAPDGRIVEWIGDGPSLLAWLTQAGRLDADAAARPAAAGSALDEVAEEARSLREWLRSLIKAASERPQAQVTSAQARRLDETPSGDRLFWRIELAGEPHRALTRAAASLSDLLRPVA